MKKYRVTYTRERKFYDYEQYDIEAETEADAIQASLDLKPNIVNCYFSPAIGDMELKSVELIND